MLRKITLSLLLLTSVVVILPFASSTAHGLRQSSASQQQRRYRRHSRAWWRRYRARMKMRRAMNAAALAHRKSELGPGLASAMTAEVSKGVIPQLPSGWNTPTVANNGELRFRTGANASVPSQATLAVVARSRPTPAYLTHREQTKLLAGVNFSDLRRIVIDKMIDAGGWVINDYERQVNGSRVFVVIAQTPGDGRSEDKSWQFYFAEVDGKIYSLTLNTPIQFSDRLSGEGEKFLNSLRSKSSSSTTLKP
ncbi:MAG TPA: hypothetical protein VJU86_12760 [Pyrinomonadaceae bacterium]|nr:hypothetical protein [Pyrinomonadaceae bacterium]